jgi:hypothetical protein
MGTQELSNKELLVLIFVQETNLNIQTAGILFDRFQEEYVANDIKMTRADVKRWIIRQGVEIKS